MRHTIVAALLLPLLGWSNLGATAAAPVNLSPPRAAARFEGCGFEASKPTALSTIPLNLPAHFTPIDQQEQVAVFMVRDHDESDREDGRSLVVLVFRDQGQADAAYDRGARLATVAAGLQGMELTSGPDSAGTPPAARLNPDQGPPLFFGYGLSVWRGNLALAQLTTPPVRLLQETSAELERRGSSRRPDQTEYETALRAALGRTKPRRHDDPREAPYPVDQDFVRCMDAA